MPPSVQRSNKPSHHAVEVIDPRWLLKTGALVIAVAMICGYLTVCGLFYFGQWQFMFHPRKTVTQTPKDDALAFSTDASMAWHVNSDSTADPTVLLLHGGDGNVGDIVPLIQLLHTARLNVYAPEYRGFGARPGAHPSKQSMEADAEAALQQLESAGSKPASIILAGQGLGASLVVDLAARHPEVAAVILDQPDGDVTARVSRDPRTHMVPVRLLLHDTFPLQAPLEKLSTPKLIVTHRESPPPLDARLAADPKMTVELAAGDQAAYLSSLRRFLDLYVARPVPSLLPAPASK